jgi:hypothetical protein
MVGRWKRSTKTALETIVVIKVCLVIAVLTETDFVQGRVFQVEKWQTSCGRL